MSRKLPLLAKFCRPRVYDAFRRPRLQARLDAAYENRRCVFVMGPPGAGKTTVVSLWLERESEPAIWYQIDAGDNDIASFFHHLTLDIHAHGFNKAGRLPALTPELERNLGGFSRRYFRELFACLPEGSLLVFDNLECAETTLQVVVSRHWSSARRAWSS